MDFTFFPVETSTYIGYIDRLYFNTLSSTTISYFQWGAYKWVKIYNTKHDRNIVSTQNKNQNAKTSYVVKHLTTIYRLYRVWTDWKFQIYIASLWDTKPMISNIQNWNLVSSAWISGYCKSWAMSLLSTWHNKKTKDRNKRAGFNSSFVSKLFWGSL